MNILRRRMSTISFHKTKHKGGSRGLQRHNERRPGQTHGNQNIDEQKTKDNIFLRGGDDSTYTQRINKIIENGYRGKRAVRKDAVKMVEWTVQIGGAIAEEGSEEQQVEVLKEAFEVLREEFGEENIVSAVIHMDETTPHLHFDFVPLTRDGKLSDKQLTGGKQGLQKLQKKLLDKMNERTNDLFDRKKDNQLNGMEQKLFEKMSKSVKKERDDLEKEKEAHAEEVLDFYEKQNDFEHQQEEFDDEKRQFENEKKAFEQQKLDFAEQKQDFETEKRSFEQQKRGFDENVAEMRKMINKNVEDVKKRRLSLDTREKGLNEREKSLSDLSDALRASERRLRGREEVLTDKSNQVAQRALDVQKREKRVDERERQVSQRERRVEQLFDKLKGFASSIQKGFAVARQIFDWASLKERKLDEIKKAEEEAERVKKASERSAETFELATDEFLNENDLKVSTESSVDEMTQALNELLGDVEMPPQENWGMGR